MSRPNHVVIKEFLDTIKEVASKGTSEQYVLMVFQKFMNAQKEFFPFVEHIKVDINGIGVDKSVDTAGSEYVGKFLKVLITTMFSDFFMRLLRKKMPDYLTKELSEIGLKLNGASYSKRHKFLDRFIY